MKRNETDLFRGYVAARLRARETWITVLVVGTFINLYGLVIVPSLRGVDPYQSLVEQLSATPAVSLLTIALGYAFPLGVSTWSSASARFAGRHTESLAQFPDRKPDPVFRVDASGDVIDAGRQTSKLFAEHQIRTAADILGPENWAQVAASVRDRTAPSRPLVVHFAKTGAWYLVTHSEAEGDQVNVYLTGIAPEQARSFQESSHA